MTPRQHDRSMSQLGQELDWWSQPDTKREVRLKRAVRRRYNRAVRRGARLAIDAGLDEMEVAD